MPPLPPVITSRTNARVKALRQSLSGEARKPGDLLGLEGPNLIKEAHMAGMSLQTIFLREGSEDSLSPSWLEGLRPESWAVLSREVFDSSVSTQNPQGVAATWLIEEARGPAANSPVGLLLESIQDPGNLGTLLRSAMAFGMGSVVVTPNSVNHWNPKVVRAAAGAIFHVSVHRTPLAPAIEQLHAKGIRVFAAVSSFLSGPEYGYPVLAARHGVLTGRVDNANAAPEYRYSSEWMSPPPKGEKTYAASFSYDADLVDASALLIGNEGAGLSAEARALADEQVLIPCSAESLNAAVAGSVLMYESMRQRLLRRWAQKQGLRA